SCLRGNGCPGDAGLSLPAGPPRVEITPNEGVPMSFSITRREALLSTGALLAAAAAPVPVLAQDRPKDEPFGYCLNTSTLQMGQKISIAEEIDAAAAAGFTAMEPWIGELQKHVEEGGTL